MTLTGLAPSAAAPVSIIGRQIMLDGMPLFLKGVNWNPVPKGGQQGHGGVHFRGFVETDSELMAAAGINALRTYEPITDRGVLDILWQKGIYVLNTVYISGDAPPESVVNTVDSLKDHPAILMWVIGNEWNYNMLYSGMDFESALNRVHFVAHLIKHLDNTHPVATVYGMVPATEQLKALQDVIDVWGLTVYTGITFGNVFDVWISHSEKPMFLAEFGADAFNSLTGQIDEASQAQATVKLTSELIANSAQNGGACIGGFIFELADEWWKDGKGSPYVHNIGGVAPGGGPFPDSTFNEEYWGIVKIDGTPRQAFRAYAEIAIPSAPPRSPPRVPMSGITTGYRMKACGANPGCVGILGNCCPGKDNTFRRCCSAASKELQKGGQVKVLAEPDLAAAASAAPLAPWTPTAQSHQTAQAPPTHCQVDAAVPCCPDGNCGSCAGNQCCPSERGSVTCPSASTALADGCIHAKLYDCTGITGIQAPSTNTTMVTSTTVTMTRHTSTASDRTGASNPNMATGSNEWRTERIDIHQINAVANIHGSIADMHAATTPSLTTTWIAISVHTTMKILYDSEQPGSWVLGRQKASCDAVCRGAGGCVEHSWPTTQAEFLGIASDLGYSCFDLQSGGGMYDPSTQQGNCGWSWHADHEEHRTQRCAAVPPAFTRRFCPCHLKLERGAKPNQRPDIVLQKRRLQEGSGRKRAPADNVIFA